MTLIDERVLFDATVICGAFVRPEGANYQLLELADDGLIDGITTDVAAYEFVYNAYKGKLTAGIAVEPELLTEFLDGFPYLFDPETTPRVSIGRNVVEQVWLLACRSGRSCTNSPDETAPIYWHGSRTNRSSASTTSIHATSTSSSQQSNRAPTSSALQIRPTSSSRRMERFASPHHRICAASYSTREWTAPRSRVDG